jgi:hypothetical protein
MEEWVPNIEDTFAQIGLQLLLTQDVELYISKLIGLVFPKDQPSKSELDKLDEKTLGALKNELKKRVEIDEQFLDLLTDFVDKRNLFVHNLNRQGWFDMSSQEGINSIWNFLGEYSCFLDEVRNVVLAAIVLHGENLGDPSSKYIFTDTSDEFLIKIRSYYPKSKAAFKNNL